MAGVPLSKIRRPSNRKIFVLVIRRFGDMFYSKDACEIIKGASYSASRLKLDLFIHITDKAVHTDRLLTPMLNLKRVDGILFVDIDREVRTLKKVIERKIPCLVMNNYLKEPINCIAIDNKNAAIEVVEYLISLGHKKIAILTGDLTTQAGRDRFEGYRVALLQNNIPINPAYVRRGNFSRLPAYQAALALLGLRQRPTAIFASSDIMALEAINAARERKLNIPRDISIAGFDDSPLTTYSCVGLTTVRQPIVEMARLGVENLYRIISGRVKQLPVKILLPAELMIRESCKAVIAPPNLG